MPRLPRYVLPGQPQHVIQRGNNRCSIFAVDEDYYCFYHYLEEVCARHACRIHAYVFMTNHFHLLLTPDNEDSISKSMQSVGRRYVQYFNATYRRSGTLWEGRYKATIIDTETYLLTCARYIELNPVRAKLVKHPKMYHWSSYRANALGVEDSLVQPHEVYLGIGRDDLSRQATYQELFAAHIDNQTIEDLRQATQKGWALGDERFKDEIESLIKRRTRPLSRGGDHRSLVFRKKKDIGRNKT